MNIDKFKGVIAKRKGLAVPNRYGVWITHPSANFNAQGLQSGSVAPSFRTSTSASQFQSDPADMFLLCDSATLPGRQINTEAHDVSMKSIFKPKSYLVNDINLSFILTNDYYAWEYFASWMDLIITRDNTDGHGHKIRFKKQYVSEIIIQQIGENNEIPAKSIRLINCYPTTLSNVDLGNEQQNTKPTCEVEITYDDWVEDDSYSTLSDLAGITSNRNRNSLSFPSFNLNDLLNIIP